jgi:hypothetical protein
MRTHNESFKDPGGKLEAGESEYKQQMEKTELQKQGTNLETTLLLEGQLEKKLDEAREVANFSQQAEQGRADEEEP